MNVKYLISKHLLLNFKYIFNLKNSISEIYTTNIILKN